MSLSVFQKRHMIWGVPLAVMALWFASFFVIQALFPTMAERGQFGDLFGAVNALFSGLAFAGVIITISLQRDELALQRQELKEQREEMVRSRKELAAQVAAQLQLVNATLAQTRALACQMRVEAIKIEGQGGAHGGAGDEVQQIRRLADSIDKLVYTLAEPSARDG
jgi:hypothetical protein